MASAFSTPPRSTYATTDPPKSAGLKPLTLPTIASASSSSPSSPALSRSNSTNSRRSSVIVGGSGTTTAGPTRPIPKRLSSISYSTSSDANSPSLRSAPIVDRGFATLSAPPSQPRSATPTRTPQSRPTSLPSSTPANEPAGLTDPPAPGPPLTLAERHADLLRFIAAKESKCLELRTQLEQHEAELLVLKTKWEKIVNKSKARESANGGAAVVVPAGDGVVEALKGVGRYLGVVDEQQQQQSSPRPRYQQMTKLSSSSSSASLVAASEPDDPWKQSSANTPDSPATTITTSVPSTRDSLSSISTAVSSLDLDAPHQQQQDSAAAWIPGGLNKKWEQIQKTAGIEKQAKRASLLISDVTGMSNSILGSLSSVLLPPPPTISATNPQAAAKPKPRPRPMSMVALSPSTATQQTQTRKPPSPSISLLDEDDEDASGCQKNLTSSPMLTPIPIKPVAAAPVKRALTTTTTLATTKVADEEDDWNW